MTPEQERRVELFVDYMSLAAKRMGLEVLPGSVVTGNDNLAAPTVTEVKLKLAHPAPPNEGRLYGTEYGVAPR